MSRFGQLPGRPLRLVLAAVVVVALLPSGLTGQSCFRLGDCAEHGRQQDLSDEAMVLAANALLGAFTGGIRRAGADGSFWGGFARGAAGGVTVYAGKKLGAHRTAGAALLGRQVAAVGSSMVLNAGDGIGLVDRVLLPLGPVQLRLGHSDDGLSRVRLDLATLLVAGYAGAHSDFRFDASSSLATGAVVFDYGGDASWHGRHAAGVVLVTPTTLGGPDRKATLSHERIHVMQRDFTAQAWAEPLERSLFGWIPGGETVHRHVALGADFLIWGVLNSVVSYEERPWEWEANFLMRPCCE